MKRKAILLTGILVTLMLVAGCSTRKNTAGTRFYHALTTRYNVYFNGNEAYKAGLQAQQQGNKDNYMEMLPLYPIGNKETTGIGTSDYERAIEKAQKAIRQHSIKRRPIRKPGRAYTDEYKKWLSRREFNPFIHRAWLLLGKAQYQKGDFPEAASTFSYIVRLYDGQTNITSEALIWLSRCYSALGWQYDAEDALNRVNNDSLPLSLAVPYASATGNYLLGSQRYKEAIPHLEKTAKNEKNKQQKARCYYLLGQTYQLLQQPEQAYQSYSKVIRLNPPYELALSARIRQTEVMPTANSRKITGKLLRLSKDEKNEEYLDQIYYALGNVYLAGKDTAQALSAYHKGIEKSTRNGVEKGILQLTLGNLYWQQARYAEAQKAYAEAIGLIDKTHREYADITTRSEILDELVPHTNTIQLQDSLQHLAGMPEADRMAVIENIIAQVTNEDLREYGFIPEFIGRLPMIFTLEGLTKEMLVKILKEPKNAILKQYQKLLELDEVKLEFDEGALEAIAEQALKKKTGARALRAIIEKFMLDIMYEIPKDDTIGSVTITRDYIENHGNPEIHLRDQ